MLYKYVANLAVIRQLHRQVNEENAHQEWQSRMWAFPWHSYGQHPPDHEWISFSARSNHLLDPDAPLWNYETINYPSKEDPSEFAVHSGYLEHKTRFTRAYCESYFVLTPSGFLHEYSSSDPALATSPLFSRFLPLCTLGPAATSSPQITQDPPRRP